MSITYNLDELGNAIGYGRDRTVYELPGTDLVVKRSRHETKESFQSVIERYIWYSMPEKDRKALPIVDVVTHKGIIHLIMKRCRNIATMWEDAPDDIDDEEDMLLAAGVKPEQIEFVSDIIVKYSLCDTHDENLGVDEEGNFYLLDAGMTLDRGDILEAMDYDLSQDVYYGDNATDYCNRCGEPITDDYDCGCYSECWDCELPRSKCNEDCDFY